MNVSIIIAGGVGSLMRSEVPNQFIEVNGKPIIIYTLEAFEHQPEIDVIEVVCTNEWHAYLKEHANEYIIHKLKRVIIGGDSGQASARNGLLNLKKCQS